MKKADFIQYFTLAMLLITIAANCLLFFGAK